jgi:hypothetical protein
MNIEIKDTNKFKQSLSNVSKILVDKTTQDAYRSVYIKAEDGVILLRAVNYTAHHTIRLLVEDGIKIKTEGECFIGKTSIALIAKLDSAFTLTIKGKSQKELEIQQKGRRSHKYALLEIEDYPDAISLDNYTDYSPDLLDKIVPVVSTVSDTHQNEIYGCVHFNAPGGYILATDGIRIATYRDVDLGDGLISNIEAEYVRAIIAMGRQIKDDCQFQMSLGERVEGSIMTGARIISDGIILQEIVIVSMVKEMDVAVMEYVSNTLDIENFECQVILNGVKIKNSLSMISLYFDKFIGMPYVVFDLPNANKKSFNVLIDFPQFADVKEVVPYRKLDVKEFDRAFNVNPITLVNIFSNLPDVDFTFQAQNTGPYVLTSEKMPGFYYIENLVAEDPNAVPF